MVVQIYYHQKAISLICQVVNLTRFKLDTASARWNSEITGILLLLVGLCITKGEGEGVAKGEGDGVPKGE